MENKIVYNWVTVENFLFPSCNFYLVKKYFEFGEIKKAKTIAKFKVKYLY